MSAAVLPTLEGFFSQVVGLPRNSRRLNDDELATVLLASIEERRKVFISGVVNLDLRTLALVRGDLSRLTVALNIFRPNVKSMDYHYECEREILP